VKDQEFWIPFMVSLFAGAVFGAWLGYGLANRTAHNSAIELDCAHYDMKTGEFKWGQPQ